MNPSPPSSTPASSAATDSGQNRFSLVLLLGGLVAFGPLSIDMYLPALLKIAGEFSVAESVVELSLTTFFVGLAVGQLFYGPLTDRFGRKPPLYFGLVTYILMSIACALAPSAHALIAFRFFQALGSCAGMVIARATVRDLFSPREAAKIFSMLMLVMGVAPILAPIAGGFVSDWVGWRAIFWTQAVLAVICLICITLLLRETRGPNRSVQLSRAFHNYWDILKDRSFLGYALSGGFAQAGMFAYITGSPYVLISLFHVPADRYGLIFGANAMGLIALSQVNARVVHVHGIDRILKRMFYLLAGFGAVLALTGVLGLGLGFTLVPLFAYVASMGMINPNTTAGALASQGSRAGSAAALLGSIQFAIAVVASGFVSHFHNGTSIPMTAIIGGCGILGLLLYKLMIRPESVAK